jgi:acyl carrier protein phosphodiesterase
MNYLAHAYLSFNEPEILVGNMISDFVKGKKQYNYPITIQKGIQIHRAIDAFTDAHPITKHAKEYLYPAVGTYSGAFIDVAYDYFLANDSLTFKTEHDLQQLATNTYKTLNGFTDILPERFAKMLPYMQQQNWLYNYQFMWGIKKSFEGVAKRAQYLASSDSCFKLFEEHSIQIQECYQLFFPQLKNMVTNILMEEQFL